MAYVLMKNHFHLVVQTPEPNLSRGMQWLNGTYASWFNRRHKRSGHLFQGRFDARLIEKEAYLTAVLRYVVLNPVRAGIVARPEEHQWSSYRATAGLDPAPEWLDSAAVLTVFGHEPGLAEAEYRSFVHAAVGREDRLWHKVTNGIYLGTEAWRRKMRKIVESKPRSTEHPTPQRAVGRPDIETIVRAVARIANQPRPTVRTVAAGPLRRLIAWLGWYEGLVTLSSIAAALRLRSEGYVSRLIRRCDDELGSNPRLLEQLDGTLQMLRA
jgi:hypothetical protein